METQCDNYPLAYQGKQVDHGCVTISATDAVLRYLYGVVLRRALSHVAAMTISLGIHRRTSQLKRTESRAVVRNGP